MKPERAEEIIARCFTKDELEFLKKQTQFIEAIRNAENLDNNLKAVEIGERLHLQNREKLIKQTPWL